MGSLSQEHLRSLLAAGEGETIEFKRRVPSREVLANILSAFANTRGGEILLGIGDRGEIVGLDAESIARATTVVAELSVLMFGERDVVRAQGIPVDGKQIVHIAVPSGAGRPINTPGGMAYGRLGSSIMKRLFDVSAAGRTQSTATPDAMKRRPRAFVAMSFQHEEEPQLEDFFRAMERAAHTSDVEVYRVDNAPGDVQIVPAIMAAIEAADLVVADFTLESANVYFETGYARAKRKHVIQTARRGTLLAYDVRYWKAVFYRNATHLEELLIKELAAYRRA